MKPRIFLQYKKKTRIFRDLFHEIHTFASFFIIYNKQQHERI